MVKFLSKRNNEALFAGTDGEPQICLFALVQFADFATEWFF